MASAFMQASRLLAATQAIRSAFVDSTRIQRDSGRGGTVLDLIGPCSGTTMSLLRDSDSSR